jgi:hypothetical protein
VLRYWLQQGLHGRVCNAAAGCHAHRTCLQVLQGTAEPNISPSVLPVASTISRSMIRHAFEHIVALHVTGMLLASRHLLTPHAQV